MSRSITIIRESRVGVSGLMLESMGLRQLYEEVESDEESEKSFKKTLWEKFRDSSLVDLGLDLLGLSGGAIGDFLAPETAGISAIIAMIPDLINAFRRFARGDKFGGALSLICAIPFAGDALSAFLEGEKALSGGAKITMDIIEGICEFARSQRPAVKAIQTGTSAVSKVVSEHLPGMEEHHYDIVNAVGALTSGDKERVIQLAKESGIKIVARKAGVDLDDSDIARFSSHHDDEDRDTPSPEALSESSIRRSRRSHSVVDLYRGVLY
jgi:hypothetical protein